MKKNKKNKKKTSWKYIKRIYPYFKKNKRHVLSYLTLTVLVSIITAVIPAISGILIENINAELYVKAILILLILFGVSLLLNFSKLLTNYLYIKFSNEITVDLKKDISSAILDLNVKE